MPSARPFKQSAAEQVERADIAAAKQAGEARHHPAVRVAGALSEIADQAPSFAACGAFLAVGLLSGRTKIAEAGARMLLSVLVATAMKSAVKAVVSRTRPHAVLDGDEYNLEANGPDGPHDHSFPSGHTAGALAAARGLARVYPATKTPAYLGAAAISLVQLPRAKHYPADLVAGAIVGLMAEAIVHSGVIAMAQKPKPPSSRGRLNIGLNALVKEGLILRYDVQMSHDATFIEVTTDAGADQAVVVQRVRDAVPATFTDPTVRTVTG